jgi:hypothetical protein
MALRSEGSGCSLMAARRHAGGVAETRVRRVVRTIAGVYILEVFVWLVALRF